MNFIARIISFHKSNRLLSHIAFWIAALLIATTTESYQSQDGWFSLNRLLFHTVTLITQIITAYFLAYFIIPGFLTSKRPILIGVYLVSGMYLICALARLLNLHVYEPLADIPPKAFETVGEVFRNVGRLLYIYFFRNLSVAIVFLFLKLLTDQYETQKKALTLEREKSKAELNLLKAQLNPHFLFNTLNNIYSLSLAHSPATSASIARLADILDYILYRCDQTLVPLSGEIALLSNYIGLEKLRYDERLKISFKKSISQEINIAPLVLLSLAENAFKHGAGDDTGTPQIDIDLEVTKDSFIFKIANTVAKIKDEDNETATGRIGLNNLKQQLQLIYGDDFSLETIRRDNCFNVTLTIQLKPEKATHEKDQVFIG